MSVLRLYEDSGLSERITYGQNFSNPDEALLSEDTTSSDKQLYLAVERNTLADAIDSTQVEIPVSDIFPNMFGEGIVIRVDSELMMVSGINGNYLTVSRGFSDTSSVDHVLGSDIFASYDSSNIIVEAYDREPGTGASIDWWKFALTQVGLDSPDATNIIDLGNLNFDETVSFWRRITIPPSEGFGSHLDVSMNLRAYLNIANI